VRSPRTSVTRDQLVAAYDDKVGSDGKVIPGTRVQRPPIRDG
jgi:hypothetical protein